MLGRAFAVAGNLEVQGEIDRGIDEGGDRHERDIQARRDAVESQPDLECIVMDLKVPKLVLQDDRHFVREARDQMLRDVDTGGTRFESDVKMMRARQHVRMADLSQHAPDDRAQGLLHDFVIGNQAIGLMVAHLRVGGRRAGNGQGALRWHRSRL